MAGPCGAGWLVFVSRKIIKVSDVDIEKIYKLLKSVPQGMDIESIDLKDGYSLKLIAGTTEIYDNEYKSSLQELKQILKNSQDDVKKIGG